MTTKMLICAVAIFALALGSTAEEQVAAELGKDTNSAVDASKKRKKREIKEINTQEKAKEAQAKKDLTDKKNVTKDVNKEINKDDATAKKDEAAAKAKAEKELKDSKTEKTGGSSWFSWMWPFGTSSDEKQVDKEKQKTPAEAKEVKNLDVVEVKVEKADKVEKTVAAEPIPQVQEPVIEKQVKTDKQENESNGPNLGRILLLYIPNVLLDATDIFTLGLSVGAKAGAEVKVTRWCQFGGSYGDDYFVEKAFDRQIGGGYEDGFAFQLAALVGESSFIDKPFGTVKDYILKESKARVLSPSGDLYEEKVRDFWGIGAEAGWLVNVKAYVHPVELADFVLGLFFIDFRDDDIK